MQSNKIGNNFRKITYTEWIVFLLGAGGYVPLIIGGIQHPPEINIASLSLWFILCGMIAYSSWKQKFAGWFMPLGWVLGQGVFLVIALFIGGHTFNLRQEEMIIIYGIIVTVSVWGEYGRRTKKWDPRILFFGGVAADMLSFYPIFKQYILPHELPTNWMMLGLLIFVTDTLVNLIFVEQLPQKLVMYKQNYLAKYGEQKNILSLLEGSLLGLENIILISSVLWLMER
jgi:hypothetical protein